MSRYKFYSLHQKKCLVLGPVPKPFLLPLVCAIKVTTTLCFLSSIFTLCMFWRRKKLQNWKQGFQPIIFGNVFSEWQSQHGVFQRTTHRGVRLRGLHSTWVRAGHFSAVYITLLHYALTKPNYRRGFQRRAVNSVNCKAQLSAECSFLC